MGAPGRAGDMSGSTSNHSHGFSLYSFMYHCIYIATHLHTLYLVWLQAVILRGRDRILPVTLSTSDTPVSPYNRRRSLKRYSTEPVWDALRDVDRVNSEMHLEAVIERVWRCTWRPCLCKLGGRNWASSEIHLEAVNERVWSDATWRPWSC